MKKSFFNNILIFILIILSNHVLAQGAITITKIKGTSIAINKGSNSGLKIGDKFSIVRTEDSEQIKIASAELIAVRKDVGVAKIVKYFPNQYPQVGDRLIIELSTEEELLEQVEFEKWKETRRRQGRGVSSFGNAKLIYKGLQEYGGNAYLQFWQGVNTFYAESLYGYFVTNTTKVGGRITYQKYSGYDATGLITGDVSLHFPNPGGSLFIPFIGGQIGFAFGGETIFVFGFYGGMNIFKVHGKWAPHFELFFLQGRSSVYGLRWGISVFN